MGLNSNDAPQSGFTAQEALEPQNVPARVVQVIDLGLQPNIFQGVDKGSVQKVHMTYELVTKFMQDDEGNDQLDKPRWLSEDMPIFHHSQEKAKSTQRMKAIDPHGTTNNEFTELADMPCLVAVTKKPRANKPGEFNNYIGAVSSPIDGMETPPLVNPVGIFLLDDPDMEMFGKFPEWLQDRIKGNLNYNGSKLQANLGEKATAEVPASAPAQPTPPPAPAAPPA